MTTKHTYPCPDCGYLVFDQPPGSYAICPVCGWEDDNVQLRWPTYAGGANHESLVDTQRRFAEVFDGGTVPYERDPEWRPVDPQRDHIEDGVKLDGGAPWPDDLTALYYWRPTYWRRQDAASVR